MEILKNILEILYLLSGPALAIAAFYGLKQVRIAAGQIEETKKARVLTSKREAYTVAGEQCKYYVKTIIPLLNQIDKIIDDKNIEYFEKSEVTIKGNEIKVKPYTKDNALDKVFEECLEDVTTVLNYLEGFSVFFTAGIAADNVGFNTLGRTYVESVKQFLPIILSLGDDGSYEQIKTLFITWNSRIEKEALLKEKDQVEEKIKKQRTITIDSIGTK